jgi:hypothetical protein
MFDIRSLEFNNSRLSGSSWRRSPTTSGRRKPAGAKIRQPEFCRRRIPSPADQIPTEILQDLAKTAGIRPDLDGSGRFQPESGHFGRIRSNFLAGIRQRRPDVAGFRRQWPNSYFCISKFFRANQTPKNIFEKIIFSENDFVDIILRRNKRSIKIVCFYLFTIW